MAWGLAVVLQGLSWVLAAWQGSQLACPCMTTDHVGGVWPRQVPEPPGACILGGSLGLSKEGGESVW